MRKYTTYIFIISPSFNIHHKNVQMYFTTTARIIQTLARTTFSAFTGQELGAFICMSAFLTAWNQWKHRCKTKKKNKNSTNKTENQIDQKFTQLKIHLVPNLHRTARRIVSSMSAQFCNAFSDFCNVLLTHEHRGRLNPSALYRSCLWQKSQTHLPSTRRLQSYFEGPRKIENTQFYNVLSDFGAVMS